jgi:hypothetical protein
LVLVAPLKWRSEPLADHGMLVSGRIEVGGVRAEQIIERGDPSLNQGPCPKGHRQTAVPKVAVTVTIPAATLEVIRSRNRR